MQSVSACVLELYTHFRTPAWHPAHIQRLTVLLPVQISPEQSLYGSSNKHIIDRAANIGKHVEPGSFDAVSSPCLVLQNAKLLQQVSCIVFQLGCPRNAAAHLAESEPAGNACWKPDPDALSVGCRLSSME